MGKYNIDQKITEEFSKYKVYCKNCGHSILFIPFENKEKKICSWCGHTVYVNDNSEFKDRLKKLLG